MYENYFKRTDYIIIISVQINLSITGEETIKFVFYVAGKRISAASSENRRI